ncbi:MAG: ATPase P, partial [Proteobacteria bacterium]
MNRARQVELPVIGMHCINCAQSVEGRLKRMGLGDVSVDLASNLARFSLEREELLPEIASQIEKLGYRTSLPKDQRLLARLFSSLNFKFWFCLVFTLPLLGHMILPFQILHDPKLQLVLCLPVYIVGCQHFGRSAFNSLRQGHGNMDVLIFLGSTAAFFYSLSGTLLELGPDYLFYETSATIITVVLLGNMLEHLSASKTGSAIEELARIQPTRARKVIGQNGSQRLEDVSISDLELGDLVQVNSGDKIPTDGIVEWGGGSINESIVTGESMPV